MKKIWVLILIIIPAILCKGQNEMRDGETGNISLFLSGDVMLGRGIDQALKHSVEPVLYESYVKDARVYFDLAVKKNGKFDIPVSYRHVWGDAIEVWKDLDPDLKLINLETSLTTNPHPWEDKGIHYRMHPENIEILTTVGIDHCSLANNHVLDWGRTGLTETIRTLQQVGIKYSGAGENAEQAKSPSILKVKERRILVFSVGTRSSGIPPEWAAGEKRPGLNYLPNLSAETVSNIKEQVEAFKRTGDLVIFSVHWGRNWGYEIPEAHREFAHTLIEEAGVDLIFGHSSHHPLGIEVYRGKLIIYGAGDLINDYEGISGQETYKGNLSLMYFPELDAETGNLISLQMVPMEIRKFRLHRAKKKDREWLKNVLNREGQKLGTGVIMENDNKSFQLVW